MKRIGSAALLFVLVASGIACTRVKQDRDDLFTAIYRTEALAREFSYEEKAKPNVCPCETPVTTNVLGAITDDYRYRLDASVDGNPAASEVVVDDARAFKVHNPSFLNRIASTAAETSEGGPSIDALAAGGWVLDPTGANQLFSAPDTNYNVGTDPMLDSLRVLQYAREAAGEAATVVKFNPESPSYRPKFDPFPPPDSKVIRYDLISPRLIPRDPTVEGASALQLPGVRYFRKMSLYVRNGIVLRILERISVEEALADSRTNIAARIGDYGIVLPRGSIREQAEFLTAQLQEGMATLGQPPVRNRDLGVEFRNHGKSESIQLPGDAISGSLAGLRTTGQILFEKVQ